jgi:hypothetical protein
MKVTTETQRGSWSGSFWLGRWMILAVLCGPLAAVRPLAAMAVVAPCVAS